MIILYYIMLYYIILYYIILYYIILYHIILYIYIYIYILKKKLFEQNFLQIFLRKSDKNKKNFDKN